jgi:hypothetical protein
MVAAVLAWMKVNSFTFLLAIFRQNFYCPISREIPTSDMGTGMPKYVLDMYAKVVCFLYINGCCRVERVDWQAFEF